MRTRHRVCAFLTVTGMASGPRSGRMESLKSRLSVVIPFHQGTEFLRQSLSAFRHLDGHVELIVVADGAVGDYEAVASEHGARVVTIAGPSGPSVARNRGASAANGDILVFVDADVVVAPDALPRIAEFFASHPDVAAVMGAYDESPAEANFVSQFKNLAHSFVHQSSKSDAQSFWAGLGAVRTDAFRNVGGFDERYTRPCIEDIDLGYRLTKAGYRIVLDPSIRGCHLKRWTFLSLLRTDFWDRGVPWTQLMLRSELLQNDLNVRTEDRVSVVLAFVLLGLVLGVAVDASRPSTGGHCGCVALPAESKVLRLLCQSTRCRIRLASGPASLLLPNLQRAFVRGRHGRLRHRTCGGCHHSRRYSSSSLGPDQFGRGLHGKDRVQRVGAVMSGEAV